MWRRPPEERGRGQCRAGAASGEERPGPRGSPRLEGGPDALAVVAGEAAGADLRLLRPPLGRHGAGRPRVPMLPEVRRRGRELGLPGTGPAGPATATARGFPHAEPRASASRPGARPPETPRSVPSPAGELGGARPRAPRACMPVTAAGLCERQRHAGEPAAGPPHVYGGKADEAEKILSTHSPSRQLGGKRFRLAWPPRNSLRLSVCAHAPCVRARARAYKVRARSSALGFFLPQDGVRADEVAALLPSGPCCSASCSRSKV